MNYEYRTNSEADTPAIQTIMFGHLLSQRYKSLVCWDGPRLPAFSTYNERLRTFDKGWPYKRRHNAELISAAGFFTRVWN
jgi:hypothetical protein